MAEIPALRRMRQGDKFQASLGYISSRAAWAMQEKAKMSCITGHVPRRSWLGSMALTLPVLGCLYHKLAFVRPKHVLL